MLFLLCFFRKYGLDFFVVELVKFCFRLLNCNFMLRKWCKINNFCLKSIYDFEEGIIRKKNVYYFFKV